MLQQRIEQDLKTALLAGDATKVSVLRSLKSAITYAEVGRGVKGGKGLSDEELVDVIFKEAKKRQESADLFLKGGRPERSEQELAEKKIIDNYLPPVLSEAELTALIDDVMQTIHDPTPQLMGKIITQVKQQATGRIDGALLARLVQERLRG